MATLLPNGKVLIAGGRDEVSYLSSAEHYDPSTGTFVPAGNMSTARSDHAMTLLPSGSVLIAGGLGPNGTSLNSAGIFQDEQGTFTPTGNMGTSRGGATATLLSGG